MCLITQQRKPIKVRKDHTVYKRLIIRHDINGDKHLISSFNEFEYKLNALYQTEIKPSPKGKERYFDEKIPKAYNFAISVENCEFTKMINEDKLFAYGQGFHSFANKNRASLFFSQDAYVECTIPKGSLVYKDKTGLIISNQIIINKIL